ncbi:MAG: hypothetical protein U1F15_06170 [Burkholderiales bacterium]
MLTKIFIAPPLGIARVGASATPCVAFHWGPNDLSPHGTGTTSLVPAETLELAADGTVTSHVPREIVFRDRQGIRPVCPFFELHAEWTAADGSPHSGPVTVALLQEWGAQLADVRWQVEVANLKPYHYTFEAGDRIVGRAEVAANHHAETTVAGVSPADAAQPLVRASHPMPLGTIQAAKPSADFPELRLRYTAPHGLIYGPTDLRARLASMDFDLDVDGDTPNADWRAFTLPPGRLTLNPQAAWCRYIPEQATLGPLRDADYRNTPGGLLATVYMPIPWQQGTPTLECSLGLVDDVVDGIITCRLTAGGREFAAIARIVVGPPDFAPANRPPVSLADNLADRDDRASVRAAQAWTKDELGELVLDILERAFETSTLMNRDYQNYRASGTNVDEAANLGTRSPFDNDDLREMLWPVPDPALVTEARTHALALSEAGTRKHRRYAALEYMEDRFRENPALFDQWIRRPVDRNPFFDRRMPALMRGSDGRPLHLTRRQWEIFREWIARVRADTDAAGMPRPHG